MTFQEIQNDVADRWGLANDGIALTRIGRFINQRYRELASSLGLQTTVRATAQAATIVGNRSLTFLCEKLYAVYDASVTPVRVLTLATFDQLRNGMVATDPAQTYAIQLMGASTVTIFLDSVPATSYTLTADVEINLTDLSGTQTPAFPADYHDILVRGAMADELERMEKPDLSALQNAKVEKRVAELRLYLVKSAYFDVFQGQTARPRRWVNTVIS